MIYLNLWLILTCSKVLCGLVSYISNPRRLLPCIVLDLSFLESFASAMY